MPRSAPRSYSDEEIAATLAVLKGNKGNLLRTSRDTGIPRITIRQWAQGKVKRVAKRPGMASLRHRKTEDLAARCREIAWLLAEAMPGKIKDAPLNQISTAFGVMVEKERLLMEKGPPPTEAQKTASEAIQRAADALVELSKRTDKPLAPEEAARMILDIQLQSAKIDPESKPS